MNQSANPAAPNRPALSVKDMGHDLISGVVVFLVALPLCLGIALASGAPLFSGLLAGIVGGIIVGSISGSHTSVSGPAAGLTAIVLAQIAALGSFEAFLLAVVIGGVIQIVFGIMKAGALSAFFPSSVIKGLLAAIGAILILKQLPHLLGHDKDPEGEMSFSQPDDETTFSELWSVLQGDVHAGAIVIGLFSVALLFVWGRTKFLKNSLVPAPLIVVLAGVAINLVFRQLGGRWLIEESHLVQVPVASTASDLIGFLQSPDFSQWTNPGIYLAGVTIAIVASLETLLNLEAVDKLDTRHRHSPPSRELIAQGCGNVVSGLIGGLPVTSVIVRSSVNVNTGVRTKMSAIFHGILLVFCVGVLPVYLNMIPLSALAAILLFTGFKLASPALFKQMWKEGPYQFMPFILTLTAIVFTDLLTGILIGLAISVLFILNSNLRYPVRRTIESHIGGEVTHIELGNQVTFLNRAALDKELNSAKSGQHLLIDASMTDYFDPDVLSLIRDFKDNIAPSRGITVSLRGFRRKYQLADDIRYVDYTTRELQSEATPDQVLTLLVEGNKRFQSGIRLSRDYSRQMNATAQGQAPLAAVLGCIDSRVSVELIFDLGLGDVFSVRVAGNVVGTKSLASLEYAVAVSGVKLVLVLGHTRCGAVTSSVELLCKHQHAEAATGCQHLQAIVDEIAPSVSECDTREFEQLSSEDRDAFINDIARKNVLNTVGAVIERSQAIRQAIDKGQAKVVGALYDVASGQIEFLNEASEDEATENRSA